MASLVGHHIADQLFEQWLPGGAQHQSESGQGQPLDDHLHAQVDDVPTGVAEYLIYQRPEVVVDGVGGWHLLVQVPGEGFDVPGLVDHLSGPVVLGVNPRNCLDQPGRA